MMLNVQNSADELEQLQEYVTFIRYVPASSLCLLLQSGAAESVFATAI